MKRSSPSKATWDVLRRLAESVVDPGRRLTANEPELILAAMVSSRDLGAVPHLLPYLLAESPALRMATANVLNTWLATADDSELVDLDTACRIHGTSPGAQVRSWHQCTESDVPTFASDEGGPGILGLISFHRKGRLREAAVRCLDGMADERVFAFLLIRCNDWVGAIREVAAAAVLRRVRPGNEAMILRHLRLVIRLEHSLRSVNHPVSLAVRTLLQSEASLDPVRGAMTSSNPWLRRQTFRWILDSAPRYERQLIQEGVRAADPMIRLWSVRRLPTIADVSFRIRLLQELGQDAFPAVRCETLQQRIVAEPDAATCLLQQALMDPHGMVRSLARHLMQSLDCKIHAAGLYRERLSSHSSRILQTAILGLGETGNPTDVATVRGFLSAPESGLRRAAVRALAGLDRSGHAAHFITALQDPSLRVVSEARSALEPMAGELTDRLRAAYRVERRARVQRQLFGLLRSLPFWARGGFLLDSLDSQDAAIARRALHLLGLWINRLRSVAVPPPAAELPALNRSLERAKSLLPNAMFNELHFLLQGYL